MLSTFKNSDFKINTIIGIMEKIIHNSTFT